MTQNLIIRSHLKDRDGTRSKDYRYNKKNEILLTVTMPRAGVSSADAAEGDKSSSSSAASESLLLFPLGRSWSHITFQTFNGIEKIEPRISSNEISEDYLKIPQ